MIDTLPIEDLRTRHESARLQLETMQLESYLAEAQRMADLPVPVMEACELIDPREFMHDTPGWGTSYGQQPVPMTRPDDRQDGKNRPVFETEQDLAFIRGSARILTTMFPAGINILKNLRNYTISGGFTYKVQPANDAEPPKGLVGAVQNVIDALFGDSGCLLENEIHDRRRTDGECFVQLEPEGWQTRILIREPDHVRDPQGFSNDLETHLHIDTEFVSCWAMGVHTRKDRPGDTLGYHVAPDPAAYADWDYVPAARMEHFKANAPYGVKRGYSEFYPVIAWLQDAEKVLRNTGRGTAVQAAIAFIRQHATGATAAQISGLRATNAYETRTQNLPQGGSRTRYIQNFAPGTILDINQGQEYLAGPMGSERAPAFINVIQALLRYLGSVWQMAEGMISGDYSNNNLASALVAESPFVKGRESDQRELKPGFSSLCWKAIRIAFDSGYFARFDMPWEQIEALVDVIVTPPEVATRNKEEQARTSAIEVGLGIKSKRTAATEAGLDFDAELENIQKDGDKPEPPLGAAQGQPANISQVTNVPAQPAPQSDGAALRAMEAVAERLGKVEALLECGGEGGKPGPCPTGKSQVNAHSRSDAGTERGSTGVYQGKKYRFVSKQAKLNIDQVTDLLGERGYKIGKPHVDLSAGATFYTVQKKGHKPLKVTAKKLAQFLSTEADVIESVEDAEPFEGDVSLLEIDLHTTPRAAAVSAALESARTTDEARAILRELHENTDAAGRLMETLRPAEFLEELHDTVVYAAGTNAINTAAIVKTIEESMQPLTGVAEAITSASKELASALADQKPPVVNAPVTVEFPKDAIRVEVEAAAAQVTIPKDAIKVQIEQPKAEPKGRIVRTVERDGEGRIKTIIEE